MCEFKVTVTIGNPLAEAGIRGMFNNQNGTIRTLALAVVLALPTTALAGGYGDSALRDGNVANVATNQPTVLCPRLGQKIPANLAAQMDCGAATPAVAGERVRNTNLLGRIFGGHKIGSAPDGNSDPDDDPVTPVSSTPKDPVDDPNDPKDNTPNDPKDNTPNKPKDNPPNKPKDNPPSDPKDNPPSDPKDNPPTDNGTKALN